MLMLRRQILGLAIQERAIQIALLRGGNGKPRLLRAATFALPEGTSWDQPGESGDLASALRRFLEEQDIHAHQAVVGLPGRWVLVKAHALPPAGPAAAAGILQLAIERQYQSAARTWAFDYAGEPSARQSSTVLLAAAPQQRIEQVVAVLEQAGLRATAIGATMLSLAQASPAEGEQASAVLHAAADGWELAVRRGTRLLAVERLSAAAVASSGGSGASGGRAPLRFAAKRGASGGAGASGARAPLRFAAKREMQRIIAATLGEAAPTELPLIVWGEESAKFEVQSAVEEEGAKFKVEEGRLPVAGLADEARQDAALAATVAMAALRGGTRSGNALRSGGASRRNGAVDFLHPKLGVKERRRWTSLHAAAAAVLLALLIGGGWLVSDWYRERAAVAQLQAQRTAIQPALDKALAVVDRATLANHWFGRRPPMLECLRDLTLTFPEQADVWATSIAVRDDMIGTLLGQATDERSVLALLDALRQSPRFSRVKLLNLRQAGRDNHAVAFSLRFVYAKTTETQRHRAGE